MAVPNTLGAAFFIGTLMGGPIAVDNRDFY